MNAFALPAKKERRGLNLAEPLGAILLFVLLATVGAKWVPVTSAGGYTLELSNMGALLAIAMGGVLVILKRELRAPLVLVVTVGLLILLIASHATRGQPYNTMIMSMVAVASTVAVANVSNLRSPMPVIWAVGGFICVLVVSVMVSGVDFVGGITEYLTTFNRKRLNATIMAPIYNAFQQGNDFTYFSSMSNTVAASFALFYILAGSYALTGDRRMIPVALLSLFVVLSIFSSSGVLTCLLTSIVFFWHWAKSARNKWAILMFAAALLSFLVTFWAEIAEFFYYNVVNDEGSRDGRLEQYDQALASIENNMLLGAGTVVVNIYYSIHNFFLYSFAAAGVAGAVLSAFVIIYVAILSVQGLRAIYHGNSHQPEALLVACLPLLFLIRVMFGGAGGLPMGAGALALGLALVARRALHIPITKPQFRWDEAMARSAESLTRSRDGIPLPLVSRRSV